jgi:acyl-CoA thioesterase FadM
MAYRVMSEAHGGALVAEGDSVVVMLNYRTGEKVSLSDQLRQRVAALEAKR